MTSTKSAVQFWTQIAKSFSLPGVIFDLYVSAHTLNVSQFDVICAAN